MPDSFDSVVKPETPDLVQVLAQNHRRFLTFLESRGLSTAVAEEVLQTAFVKTLEKPYSLRDGDSAVAWLFQLLRNAATDHYRRSAAESRAVAKEALLTQHIAAFEDELKGELCSCLGELLSTLKPEYEQIVREVDLDEGSISDVAQRLGISPGNASVRLHRGRQALKKQLERCCGACATHGCLDCDCQRTKRPEEETHR